MYSEIQRERPDLGSIMAHPDYIDGNPDLIKPKKLLNPVRASKSHQELHRELLMNHKRAKDTIRKKSKDVNCLENVAEQRAGQIQAGKISAGAPIYPEDARLDSYINHKGLGVESKPELQRVLEHRRRNQMIRQRKEEEEAKKLKSPFEQELLKRQQRLDQLEREKEKQEENAPEFVKVKEKLRRTSTLN